MNVRELAARIAQRQIVGRAPMSYEVDEVAFVIVAAWPQIEAQALREAADAWDSEEELPHMTALADERYQPGGPSMPEIWLRDRAEKKEQQ